MLEDNSFAAFTQVSSLRSCYVRESHIDGKFRKTGWKYLKVNLHSILYSTEANFKI